MTSLPPNRVDQRIIDAFNAEHDFRLQDSLVMLSLIGSHSHGTYVPPTDPDAVDDIDYMGVIIPPITYTLGTKQFEHWVWKQDELDVVFYSFQKMARLLIGSNPNVLGTLWLRPDFYIVNERPWQRMVENRSLFATKKAYGAFVNYAKDQLERMQTLKPEYIAAYDTAIDLVDLRTTTLDIILKGRSNATPPFPVQERSYQWAAEYIRWFHAKFHQKYMGEKRKNLIKKYGYDTKMAAHAVRLLQMGVEFLETGEMNVFRDGYRGELIRSIKRGEWDLLAVKELADTWFVRADTALKATKLPETVHVDSASRLTAKAIYEFISDVELVN
jgi:hypothetical protein